MIVDSSAIIALVLKEPGWEQLLHKLAGTQHAGIGAPTLAETGIVLAARLGRDPRGLLGHLLDEVGVSVVHFGPAHWKEAVEAYQRFGKGRHRASLNFGDCLTYAVAKLADQPLLCMGADFGKTDLPARLSALSPGG